MRAELPPIAKLSARLLVSIEQAVLRFARGHKYTIGSDLRAQAMSVSRTVDRAWRERSRALHYVHELTRAIDDLRLTMQLGKDIGAFRSFGEFEALARLVTDLGKQCGGWLKKLHSTGQNGRGEPLDQRALILSSRTAPQGANP